MKRKSQAEYYENEIKKINKIVTNFQRDTDLYKLNLCRTLRSKKENLLDHVPSGKVRNVNDSLYNPFMRIFREIRRNCSLCDNLCSIIADYALCNYVQFQKNIYFNENVHFVNVLRSYCLITEDNKKARQIHMRTGKEQKSNFSINTFEFPCNSTNRISLRNRDYILQDNKLYELKQCRLRQFIPIENVSAEEYIYHIESIDYERLLYVKSIGKKKGIAIVEAVLQLE
jgi:hypothetical protein